jgi:serine/threonine protein kinase
MKSFAIKTSLEEELSLLRRVIEHKHANIIEIQDCWVGADEAYIVMELCQANLAELQKKFVLPLPTRLLYEILVQVARGIEHLHSPELRLCHRDLKPQNGNTFKSSQS